MRGIEGAGAPVQAPRRHGEGSMRGCRSVAAAETQNNERSGGPALTRQQGHRKWAHQATSCHQMAHLH
eukprot:15458226-Alexandrium_andersonii.AAC.1